MIVRSEMVIDRPCDEVFELVADRLFDTYHLWNTGVLEVQRLDSGRVQVGARGVALMFVGKDRSGMSGYREEGCAFEVVRYVEGRELVLDESDPHPAIERTQMKLFFDPAGPRTRLRAAEELWGNSLLALGWPIVWIQRKNELRRNLRRLRAALQARVLPPPPRRPG